MSLRLRLLNLFFRRIAKPVLRHTHNPGFAKRSFALAARVLLLREKGVRRVALATAPQMLWLEPLTGSNGRVIVYFHGGGYLVGSPKTHAGLGARLAVETGCAVCLPAYRLVPAHPFPAAFEDAVAAWDA
ncbi:MAG: alpha/beta hydrolase, partial [Paracoccaceae bacterium]